MIDKTKLAKLLKNLEKLKAVKESGALGGFIVDLISKIEIFLSEKEKLEEKFDETVKEIRASVPNLDTMFKSVKGKQGEVGEVGPRGERGEKGDSIIGKTGPQGPRGEKGEKGLVGRDGISPDPMDIASRASKLTQEALTPLIPTLMQIEDDIPKLGEKIRDSLEILSGDERLEIKAIKDLQEKLDALDKKKVVVGGGGFNYGALDLHIIDDETPTGTPNGVLTTFTINHAPSPVSSLKVYLDGMRMKLTTDYTFSSTTITFLTAPLTDSIITVEYRI